MKGVIASAAILSCVFFESECGFGRFWEKAGKDIGKATRNIGKAAEREVRNFNDGTILPAAENTKKAFKNYVEPELKSAEENISKNNDRLKSWFHREAQPKVKELEVSRLESEKKSIVESNTTVPSTESKDQGITGADIIASFLESDESGCILQ